MNEKMDGWMAGWMDEGINGWLDGCMGGGWIDWCRSGRIDRLTEEGRGSCFFSNRSALNHPSSCFLSERLYTQTYVSFQSTIPHNGRLSSNYFRVVHHEVQ